MNRTITVAILAISLAAAAVTGYCGQELWSDSGRTVPLVTASQAIPPYALITADMLDTREMPEALSREPVFLQASEVVGKIAAAPIPAGGLIYRDFAVPVESFRLTADPGLEVVSFPARPEKAVGGQVRPGQRINVYRVAVGSPPTVVSPEQALATRGAEAQLLASSVLVADVRTGQGEAPVSAPSAQEARGRSSPPTIITVAATPEVARAIIALVGETRGAYDLWVTLAPVDGATSAPSLSVEPGGGQR